MEITTGRYDAWKGGAIGIGACLLTLAVGEQVQAVTGSAGVLLGLLLAAAAASWYAGRWAGVLTTGAGALAASYFLLPPVYSLRIAEQTDSAALYSFALGGIIVSLLCVAAWQLRQEARTWQGIEQELARLRAHSGVLEQQVHRQQAMLAASERFLHELAQSVQAAGGEAADRARHVQVCCQTAAQPVDCSVLVQAIKGNSPMAGNPAGTPGSLPTVWGKEPELRSLFEILLTHAAHPGSPENPRLTASRLPDVWLFTCAFRHNGGTPPLSALDCCACEWIVARQGGRSWINSTTQGDWELMFSLPRREPMDAPSNA